MNAIYKLYIRFYASGMVVKSLHIDSYQIMHDARAVMVSKSHDLAALLNLKLVYFSLDDDKQSMKVMRLTDECIAEFFIQVDDTPNN